jgi:hypothetical protein
MLNQKYFNYKMSIIYTQVYEFSINSVFILRIVTVFIIFGLYFTKQNKLHLFNIDLILKWTSVRPY